MPPASAPLMSVSSFSLRERLGPIVFRYRDPSGAEQTLTFDNPRELAISEFPRRAKDELGVDAVETCGFHFTGLDDPEVDRFEAALDQTGVGLMNIALDMGNLGDPDDARRAGDIEELKRWIARFAAMGSTFVRVNPGTPGMPQPGDGPSPWLVASLVELGEYANDAGTRLLVENHGGPSSDPAWMDALLEAVGRPACGLLLDLGNFDALTGPLHAALRGGVAPEDVDIEAVLSGIDLTPLYAAIEALAPRAELLSVKSHVVSEEGEVGVVDFDRAFGILAGHGYDGPLSVEYEGMGGDPWAKSRRVVEVAREAFLAAQQRS